MRIAIDVTASLYKGTGVATYYNNLIPELLRYEDGVSFVLFGYSLRRLGELTLARKKFPFPPRLAELIWNKLHIFPVERLIGKCDVLHSWDYIQPPTQKAKIVTTIHDLTPLKFPEQQHPRTLTAYKQGLNWVKKEAAAVITDSYSTRQDIIELLQIPEEKIQVVYLAAPRDFHEFRSRHENTRDLSIDLVKRKYGIEGGYILSLGTQEPRKNLERSIRAHEALGTEMTLVIAGRYGWGKKVEPAPGVKVLDFVPTSDIPALYAGASCFVYPSLYEGFGLPVLEAMAVGCPVVTSDRGSLSEVAGEAAIKVNPESVEAIAFGIRTALQRGAELREKGIEQAQRFSWENTAAMTMGIYTSLTPEKKKLNQEQKKNHEDENQKP